MYKCVYQTSFILTTVCFVYICIDSMRRFAHLDGCFHGLDQKHDTQFKTAHLIY